jgi:alpha-1,3-rhamnosyl/mannosyltransferase
MGGTVPSPFIRVDCSPLLLRSAGVKTYLYHWLRSLRKLSPDTVGTFLAPPSLDQLSHDGGPRQHPLRILELLSLNRLPDFVSDMVVPRCDVLHVSSLLRRFPRKPAITGTFHDLTAWLLPECHTPANVAGDKAFAERIRKRAKGVIAVSENTKRDAVRLLNLDPDFIRVIYPGISPAFFQVSPDAAAQVARDYNLPPRYFLFVSTIEPRKNLGALLDAWNSLPPSVSKEASLVIAGMEGWRAEATMRRIEDAVKTSSAIRRLGYVPGADLPALMAGARALVYPSLYEGFGFPVVEAMAAGCPVITSNVSSLPEIAGDAALLVDPRSVAEIAAAIQKLAESESLRSQLSAGGKRQAFRYTWEAAAEQSLRYFSELA